MKHNPIARALTAVYLTAVVLFWAIIMFCFEVLRWTALAILWCIIQAVSIFLAIKKAATKRT